ncbi:MAG: hypothetical protein ACRDXB_10995, partial [Actinomycetes bacterium]
MNDTEITTTDGTVSAVGTSLGAPAERLVLDMWRTPVYQADCTGAAEHLPHLRELSLDADKTDERAAGLGGGNVIDSSQTMLTWGHPSIGWLRHQIGVAADTLARAVRGEAADEIDDGDVHAEAWAVICRPGES